MTDETYEGNLFTLPDAEWSETLEGYGVAYRAERFGSHWNGWATPVVSRQVMEAFVAQMQFRAAAYPEDHAEADVFTWDGNGVLVTTPDGTPTGYQTWVMPDDAGNFDLAVLGYCFSRVEDDARVLHSVA